MATPTETRFALLTDAKLRDLARLEAPMLRALEYLKSPQYQQDCMLTLQKIDKVVQSGRIDQNEALLIVGRLQQILADWKAQQVIIDEYDSLKRSLNLNPS